MSKIQDALSILAELGLPKAQQNDRSALTLLALADLKEKQPWTDVKQRNIGIHYIMIFIKNNYKKIYAENSRETIRRQTLHQFEQAGLVIRNADDPSRPTNSAKNVYCLSDDAVRTISRYRSRDWSVARDLFIKKKGRLIRKYKDRINELAITAIVSEDREIQLSPGRHNELEKSVVSEFRHYFCPKTVVLYVGDTANKMAHIDSDTLETLGFPASQHDKMPDVILFDNEKNVLFLIEVVTAHGPVSPKRRTEIEAMLKKCKTKRIYISAFPDFREFKKHASDIAWETEVWIKEDPKHMIHLNGDKFFTIYE